MERHLLLTVPVLDEGMYGQQLSEWWFHNLKGFIDVPPLGILQEPLLVADEPDEMSSFMNCHICLAKVIRDVQKVKLKA